MSALQWIVKEAKSLKKSYPKRFTKWTDYVKQASAIYASKHGGKSPVGKKKAVKKIAVKKAAKKKVGVIKKTVLRSPLKKKTVIKGVTAYDVLKFREKIGEKKFRLLTPAQRVKGAAKKPSEQSILNKIHKVKHEVERLDELQHKHMSGIFDVKIISDLDSLKKQYFKLAKKYHPDAGGTTIQFQQLQAEYDSLLKKLLRGSSLNTEQQENEIVIDQAIRDIINSLINIEGLNVEVIGKWLWISGDTYPVRTTLKQAGLTFIKKGGLPYWVYKGVESTSRGKMSIEDIKAKYGTHKFDVPKTKKISGVVNINRTKLKSALEKVKKGLNKRPI